MDDRASHSSAVKRRRLDGCTEGAIRFQTDGRVLNQIGTQHVGGSVHNTIQYCEPHSSKLDPVRKRRSNFFHSLGFDEIEARHATITPPHAQTCRWLFKRREYRDWLQDDKLAEHHGLLWIKGNPATGKSTVMKFILTNIRKQKVDTSVVAFFFNARGTELEKSTEGMYRSLIFQLLNRQPGLHNVFDNFPVALNGSTPKWDNNTLVNLFNAIIDRIDRPVICFIDALDECDPEQVRIMVQDFEHIGRMANVSHARFRICLSSRHYPHITVLHGISLVLEDQMEHTDDLTQYLKTELRIGSSAAADQIKGEVLAQASGIFLWVVLVVRMLNKEYDAGQMDKLRKRLDEIPGDVESLFNDMLTRDGQPEDELILCLQWVLFACHPLRPEELYCAIRALTKPASVWDKEQITAEEIDRYLLNCSKGLVESTKGKTPTVQFIHESVRTHFFFGPGLQSTQFRPAYTFWARSHDRLKQCCEAYYVNANVAAVLGIKGILPDLDSGEAEQLLKRARKSFPFLDYAVKNVLFHSHAANNLGMQQDTFIDNFALPQWTLLHSLIHLTQIFRIPLYLNLVYVLAKQNFRGLIEIALRQNPGPKLVCGRHECLIRSAPTVPNSRALRALRSPILSSDSARENILPRCDHNVCEAAITSHARQHSFEPRVLPTVAEYGHASKVGSFRRNSILLLSVVSEKGQEMEFQTLLRMGMDKLVREGLYGGILVAPSFWGHEGIILMLLQQGVDVNWTGKHMGSALYAASMSGRKKVVKLLLKARANPDAQGVDLVYVHKAASFFNYYNAFEVEMCLMERLDTTTPNEPYDNALQAASSRGYEQIVAMLIDAGADVNIRARLHGTALSAARKLGHELLVHMLLEAGAQ